MAQSKRLIYPWNTVVLRSYVNVYQRVPENLGKTFKFGAFLHEHLINPQWILCNNFSGMNPIFRPIDPLAIPQKKTSCLCNRVDTDFAKFQAVVHWDDALWNILVFKI